MSNHDEEADEVADEDAPPRRVPPGPAPRDGFASGVNPRGTGLILWGGFIVLSLLVMAIIAYDPEEPLWHTLVVIGPALCMPGLGLLLRHHVMKLWRNGGCCEGEVIKTYMIPADGTGANGRSVSHFVKYAYAVDGERFERQQKTIWLWEEKRIWVVYDPKNPARSLPTL